MNHLQTEQRRRAEAARKAAEAAAEAKQEADIAAYHASLRNKEASERHQTNLGRDNQPAGCLLQVYCTKRMATNKQFLEHTPKGDPILGILDLAWSTILHS